jgi:hypothetical protein
MNTRILMTASAGMLAAAGLLLSFIPAEVLPFFDLPSTPTLQLLLQVLGGLYFGYGMLNWMAKASLLGGIYNRPIAIANFAHFFIAGLALMKGVLASPAAPTALWGIALIYCLFSVCFGLVLFRHPLPETKPEPKVTTKA